MNTDMKTDNSSGYIYCFSNISMPGIYKIGMTERTPEKRLSDANNCDTWRPPTPYKIEFAKKVMQPRLQENILHKILTEFGARINEKREFFSISIDKIKEQFDQINGEDWVPRSENIAETILETSTTKSAVNNSKLELSHETNDSGSVIKTKRKTYTCTSCNKIYLHRQSLHNHKLVCKTNKLPGNSVYASTYTNDVVTLSAAKEILKEQQALIISAMKDVIVEVVKTLKPAQTMINNSNDNKQN